MTTIWHCAYEAIHINQFTTLICKFQFSRLQKWQQTSFQLWKCFGSCEVAGKELVLTENEVKQSFKFYFSYLNKC